jgi:hypothetical protein
MQDSGRNANVTAVVLVWHKALSARVVVVREPPRVLPQVVGLRVVLDTAVVQQLLAQSDDYLLSRADNSSLGKGNIDMLHRKGTVKTRAQTQKASLDVPRQPRTTKAERTAMPARTHALEVASKVHDVVVPRASSRARGGSGSDRDGGKARCCDVAQ